MAKKQMSDIFPDKYYDSSLTSLHVQL